MTHTLTGPVTLAGHITSGADGFVGGSSGTGYITGDIGDLDAIPRPFYKIGVNTIVLTGDNTYKGQTWIRNGTLRINSIADVGAASSALGAPQTVALIAWKRRSKANRFWIFNTGAV